MRWFLTGSTLFALVLTFGPAAEAQRQVPPRHQVTGPIQLQQELGRVLADVSALEGKIQNLRGDFRTMKDVQRRLKAIQGKLTRLIAVVPSSVQPVIVMAPPVVRPPPVAPPKPTGPVAMAKSSFTRLVSSVKRQAFSSGKLDVIRAGASSQHFTVVQVKTLLATFAHSSDKLECARVLAPKIVDRENVFELYDSFTFSSDKKKLKKILGVR